MITNISKITYDLGDLKDLSVKSNIVRITIYNNIINVCLCKNKNTVCLTLINNTGDDVYCLSVVDYNNDFNFKQKKFFNKETKTIEYNINYKPKILISYIEKYNKNFSKVYICI